MRRNLLADGDEDGGAAHLSWLRAVHGENRQERPSASALQR
jgi:hypothetical protein